MNEIIKYLPFIIPLLILHWTLAIIALVDLFKRKKVRFNNKYFWAILIICIQMFGSVAYYVARGDEE